MSRSKYGNVKTMMLGEKFDSKKEAERHLVLLDMQKKGEISKLERQPKFDLVVNDLKICRYVGDWRYLEGRGLIVIEDAKGVQTPAFRIKWKLAQALHPGVIWRLS